ncbi:MAG: hypothetical protein NTZ74_03000 [Chloroflexi bacterium]|nr:hypothetical protein [Chloroflexota bacterium]
MQSHYIESIKRVAQKLKDLPCVIGFDTLNIPQRGYVEVQNLSRPYGELEMGVCPTPWESMLLGAGFPQKVKQYERTIFGTRTRRHEMLNSEKKSAWLPGYDCVWRQHGVWDLDPDGEPVLLKSDYFSKVDGREINFVQDYLLPFMKKMVGAIRTSRPDYTAFLESEVNLFPPLWPQAGQENIVFAPHWYDGALLFLKKYSPFIGYDVITKKPVFGTGKVNRSFTQQLRMIKKLAKERLGNVPVLIGEIGIPFDMQEKKAYLNGDFTNQVHAMERTMRALENNFLNFTLWNYTADNTNSRGDQWNDEDLSIFSRDQQTDRAEIHSGGRAEKGFVRPYPLFTSGEPDHLQFESKTGSFHFSFSGNAQTTVPTEIFCPSIQYPDGVRVRVSDGRFETDLEKQRVFYFSGDQLHHWIKFDRI